MDDRRAYLEVAGIDGQMFTVSIADERVTVGRFEEHNDIALQPDPQQLVSRVHL